MNAILPNSDRFGALDAFEVYDYFDGPILFACRNAAGQIYLGMLVSVDETSRVYWLVAMSMSRFSMTRSGGIGLRGAYMNPEMGFVYNCTVDTQGTTDVTTFLPAQLDAGLVPDSDEFIVLETETLHQRFEQIGLAMKAVSVQRELIGLHFKFPGSREEAPTKALGRILISVQDTLDALGQSMSGSATLRGSIAPELLLQTETRLIQAAGGSFAVEISAAQALDLFGNSLITDALNQFVSILEIGNSTEALRDKLMEIKPRAASKYRQFLSNLLAADSPLRLEWASPQDERNKTVELSLADAAGALLTAEQVTDEVGERKTGIGYFVGVELTRRTFTAVLREDDDIYRGRIDDAVMPIAEHITLNLSYRITIRETLEISSSGEEKTKYALELIENI